MTKETTAVREKRLKREKALEQRITNQWREFSKTEAYKQFIDYIDMQDYFAISAAKGPVETFYETEGEKIAFNRENASCLLQRSVGYDIVKMYVEGYTNPEASNIDFNTQGVS